MTKITVSPDCGNAPKKQFLKEIIIAFAKGNTAFLTESVTDRIVWNLIGDRIIEGKEKFTDEIGKTKIRKVSELIIDKIVTHGKEGALNGIVKMQNGKKYAFSDFYEFSGVKATKVKAITSYFIEI
ncbi:nuclear transport factor 2 family protein [Sinomicrobium weinanense]|uniref:Nuclear transport factor 2 family protein n=1 Tax=Sinomicrobium weinanense TaxID=2842200 RepID=A0A926Q3G0_9FLAO|nr:nuclear transport factor 2 family protein [Sinomicrobium weinanense]MBC9795971.1 nuclear transport factor 2 family protein [Sinomicrobium weinanense]MBU3122090.1 nuclear transport factor 2 family protein [Sinomicrobium weinanense]